MKLVLVGKEPIETLEKWVIDMFSPIVNTDVVIPDLNDPPAYTHENLG
jgi:secreted Zn-dependent insulinase-like peptidase